jgi:hypothetical protein
MTRSTQHELTFSEQIDVEIGCWVVTEQKTHLSGHVPRDFDDLLDKVSLN